MTALQGTRAARAIGAQPPQEFDMPDPTLDTRPAARLQPLARRATAPHATARPSMGASIPVASAASVAIAAAAGWAARGPATAGTPAAQPAPAPAATPVPLDLQPPLIAVASDGRVTLRVEQQPLDWVLEQIAVQSGRPELAGFPVPARPAPAAAVPAAHPAGHSAHPAPPRADPGSLLFAVEHGADDARAEALLQAQAAGLRLPEPLLRSLLETAASDRVRLAALDNWLALHSGDARSERAALEAALLVPSAAVQQEARQRLDDLDEIERMDAEAARGRSP
jgi:hypothetical protein